MRQGLCAGIRVLDLGDDVAARAARILTDLGADVVRVVPPSDDPLAGRRAAELAWTAGTRVTALGVRVRAHRPALGLARIRPRRDGVEWKHVRDRTSGAIEIV